MHKQSKCEQMWSMFEACSKTCQKELQILVTIYHFAALKD